VLLVRNTNESVGVDVEALVELSGWQVEAGFETAGGDTLGEGHFEV
jgi:hypothetical protein